MGITWLTENKLKIRDKKGDLGASYELGMFYLYQKPKKKDPQAGLRLLEKAARGNYSKAQYALGQYCEQKAYLEDAKVWYLQAAENLEPMAEAQFRLALLLKENNPSEAFRWFKQAADSLDYTPAIRLVGDYFYEGNNPVCPKDYDQATIYYLKCHEKLPGSVDFVRLNQLGMYHYSNQNYSKAIPLFYSAARDNGEAQNMLGICYSNGYGVVKNHTEALGWFVKAANASNADAALYLGKCYESASGIKQDIPLALHYYKQAAEAGMIEGIYRYGLCLYKNAPKEEGLKGIDFILQAAKDGLSEAQNIMGDIDREKGSIEDAKQWYRLAADNVSPSFMAQYNLSELLEAENLQEAFQWCKKSADLGNYIPACRKMGSYYLKGLDNICSKSLEKASEYYKKVIAEAENTAVDMDVFSQLANYYTGAGDYEEAFFWYQSAASGGSMEAWDMVGICYEEGKGIGKDQAAAIKAYEIAAGGGIAHAQYKYGEHLLIKKRYSKGFKYMYEAAQTITEAMVRMGDICCEGLPKICNISYPAASEYYTEAMNRGWPADRLNDNHLFQMAKYYYTQKIYEASYRWFNLAANNGNQVAYLMLAYILLEGYITAPDKISALQYLQKAEEVGVRIDNIRGNASGCRIIIIRELSECPEVLYQLGNYCYTGIENICNMDFESALVYYEAALNGGFDQPEVERFYQVAQKLQNENKYSEALRWYKNAYRFGSHEAAWILSLIYFGRLKFPNVSPNMESAMTYLIFAAEKNGNAMAALGNCYYNGSYVAKDPERAAAYYRKSAEMGNADGAYRYGFCCLHHIGTKETSYSTAYKMLKFAADNNITYAYESLGVCYELGLGTGVSLEKALYYYALHDKLDDKEFYRQIEDKNYEMAFSCAVRDKLWFFEMFMSYYGIGTNKQINNAAELYMEYYKSSKETLPKEHYTKSIVYLAAEAAMNIGLRHEETGDYDKAERYYRVAMVNNHKAAVLLSHLLFEQGRYEAISLLETMTGWDNQNGLQEAVSYANYMLGQYYEYFYFKFGEGNIVKQDIKKAKEYYSRANNDSAISRMVGLSF